MLKRTFPLTINSNTSPDHFRRDYSLVNIFVLFSHFPPQGELST